MNITARGRTWAALLAGAAALGITAGALSAIGPDLHTLDATVKRVYSAVNDGDLAAIYAADPDCDGVSLDGRAMGNTLGVRFEVINTRAAGNLGSVDTAITIPGQDPSYGTASWQLTTDGAWRLLADGEC